MSNSFIYPKHDGLLYDPRYEHDGCGVGFVADISGKRSHSILERALEAVINLTHRGAASADGKSGDGAGILTQIPQSLFREEALKLDSSIPSDMEIAVGMIFLPPSNQTGQMNNQALIELIEKVCHQNKIPVIGWRKVPIDPTALGNKAQSEMPDIRQILLRQPADIKDGDEFERILYLTRKTIERLANEQALENFYIPSFSHRTIVYKGLLVAPQLAHFYYDLQNSHYQTSLAVFHQRYSTNTFPTWALAQPFRFLAHNGEINTLQGNENSLRAREAELTSPVWGARIKDLLPIVWKDGSDSSKLDNILELLVESGRHPLHAMMMLIPEAYQNMPHMDEELAAFFEYHATLTEPWDGPASVAFSDGIVVGATLDRNGLRPFRYVITDDGIMVMASEVGVVDIPASKITEKGRLGPGKMIAVDTRQGRLMTNLEIKSHFAHGKPYGEWLGKHMVRPYTKKISDNGHVLPRSDQELQKQQIAFGYGKEDLDRLFAPMAQESKEPIGSMGDDTPLSVLSEKPRNLYTYFKQRFAQVTNPPIDPLREKLVMSLRTSIGVGSSLLEESENHAKRIKFASPLFSNQEIQWVRDLTDPECQSVTLPTLFDIANSEKGLEISIEQLCSDAVSAIDAGKTVLILSDRGVDEDKAPMPMLLAVSAVHHHLIREGRRMRATIICESGEARDDHQLACLLGYGASAINPYLAFETVAHLASTGNLDGSPPQEALDKHRQAAEKGILKIMSKMGISTLSGYRGAQIFEAIGLDKEMVNQYFTGTDSRIGGVDLKDIARDVLKYHSAAFSTENGQTERSNGLNLPDYGFYRFRKEGEQHAFSPEFMRRLHKAVRTGDYEEQYRIASSAVSDRNPLAIRDLLTFNSDRESISIDEVEPAENIVKRFFTAAMSHGALSREAHITLAIAMNRLGANSNTGEGGEESLRYHLITEEGLYPGTNIKVLNGDSANCTIKQVASARFGVTAEYLQAAQELDIKMAQGSKPGEGGQLPGHKVSEQIAEIRHAVAGTSLISPPPHHDIYSIEDLAQLIYDLKRANPRALVAVKLVAEAGVGTVAAGVAKGYADTVQISGHDGGTAASPWGSIKNAGIPWELGLAETQQVLVLNNLRGRIRIRVDGGLKIGRDVIMGALLGADEFGFGSAAVTAAGCVMARQCHLNTCPVGVATQREDLRAKFPGQPEHVVNYMLFVATEAREFLAKLGYQSIDEIIGRVDMLKTAENANGPKSSKIDLDALLADADPERVRARHCEQARNDRDDDIRMDDELLESTDLLEAIENKRRFKSHQPIRNIHRTVGATISGEIARRYGDAGLDENSIQIKLTGSAGQSLGAFLVKGMQLELEGDAQDYVAKGMGGGEIIIRPPIESKFEPHENVIIGNTILYGATGGALYAAGIAGERFAVRNSGGSAVIEGVGDHGCEYMTGGIVVVLGETGRNFGAGMTAGTAFVIDEGGDFVRKYNPDHIRIERIKNTEDEQILRCLIQKHQEKTGSSRAVSILEKWDAMLPLFWKIIPHPEDERRPEDFKQDLGPSRGQAIETKTPA